MQFFMSNRMDVLRKNQNVLKSSCGQFILKSNPILKLSCITKTFKVNVSKRGNPIFFSVRRCMDSILLYDIKENTHELTPLIRKSAVFIGDTPSPYLLIFIF